MTERRFLTEFPDMYPENKARVIWVNEDCPNAVFALVDNDLGNGDKWTNGYMRIADVPVIDKETAYRDIRTHGGVTYYDASMVTSVVVGYATCHYYDTLHGPYGDEYLMSRAEEMYDSYRAIAHAFEVE